MSKKVDERVVEMRFDNQQFESGVKTTMSTLDKLKAALKFPSSTKSLDSISNAAKKVDFSGMQKGIETVNARFSAMQVVGMTALSNITSAAMNAGGRIAQALTIQPITSGFQEYETQMGAIQTILANTQSKGSTLDNVNSALSELNKYADQTIYNFTEMTRNIATFTAAGVDLDKSVTSIKGIANLAAVSGSTSAQASTAMYQLSQAIAAGKVQLMDWNSVVNAGMGGELFQNALKRTAEHFGTDVDAMIEKYGSFRESLTKGGWLTTDVLTETLTQLSGAYTEADLIAQGYSESQAKEIVQLANTAVDAATEVKTFTQLIDTLQEALGSGWAQSWQIIVGDFEEAKALFSDVSNVLGDMINQSSESRNAVLQGWKDLGGRTALIDGLRNVFTGLMSIIKPISEAFREIFPPITAETLFKITEGFRDLTSKLILNDEASASLKSTFKGLFSVLDLVGKGIGAVFSVIGSLLGVTGDLGGGLLGITGSLGEFISGIHDAITSSGIFEGIVDGMSDAISNFGSILSNIGSSGADALSSMFSGLGDILGRVGGVISKALSNISEGLKTLFENSDISSLLDVFNSGMFSVLVLGITKFFGNLGNSIKTSSKGLIDSLKDFTGNISENITGILDGVRGSLTAWQNELKSGTLLKIAVAIGILAASLTVLATIDKNKLTDALGAITMLFIELMVAMSLFTKMNTSFTAAIGSFAFIGMASGILIMASALKSISDLDIDQIKNGVIGIAGLTAIMVAAAKAISMGGGTVIKGAAGFVIFAAAIKVLASACRDLSSLKFESMIQGLLGVGVLMGEIAIFMNVAKFNPNAFVVSLGILALSGALKILASVCQDFGTMDVNTIIKGLGSIGILLGEIAAFNYLNGKTSNMVGVAIALIGVGAALHVFVQVLQQLGAMSWQDVAKGLVSIAVALAAVTLAARYLPTENLLLVSGALPAVTSALLVLADAMDELGTLSWSQVLSSLVASAGAMTILVVSLRQMDGQMKNAATMLVLSAALVVLAGSLTLLSGVGILGVATSLIGLAGTFTILGIAGKLLGPLIPTFFKLAGSITTLGLSMVVLGAGVTVIGAGLITVLTGLVTTILALQSVNIGDIAKGLITIVAVFAVIGGAATLLKPLIPTIVTLSGSIALLGLSCLSVSVAVSLLVASLTALGSVGPEGAATLVETLKTVIVGILDLIPTVISTLVESAKTIVSSFINAVVELAPQIATGILSVLTETIKSLSQYAPQIVGYLLDFVIGIIYSLADHMPELVQAVINLFSSLITAVMDALGGLDSSGLINSLGIATMLAGLVWGLASILPMIPAAMGGVLGLGVVIAELTLVLAAIGALAQIPGLDWLVSEGGNLLQSIGTAIGQFVGGIVGGIAEGVTSTLPAIGTSLSEFMTNLQPFIQAAQTLDPSMMDGVRSLAETILILTGADLLDSLASFLTGGSSLSSFAEQLQPFGEAMAAYSDAVSGIDPECVTASATAAKALAEMANAMPKSGGVFQFFTGEGDLGQFSQQLVSFGMAMRMYSMAIVGINPDVITASATAGKALIEMAGTLPGSGGVFQFFTGEKDLGKFSTQLMGFGMAMKMYSLAIVGLNPEVVTASTIAGKALIEMAGTLPNTGGLFQFFSGEQDLTSFAQKLIPFGTAMKAYSVAITGINPALITASAIAGTALINMASTLPNTGGLFSFFEGEQDLVGFAQKLIPFGMAMKAYSVAITGINPEVVAASATAGEALIKMASSLPNTGGLFQFFTGEQDIASFAQKLIPFGMAMKTYSLVVTGFNAEAVMASASAGSALAELAKTLPNSGGLFEFFSGGPDLSTFSEQIVKFGAAMKLYSMVVTGFNAEAVTASISAGTALAELSKTLPSSGSIFAFFTGEQYDLSTFGSQIVPFGLAMKMYSLAVTGFNAEAVTASTSAGSALLELAKTLPSSGGVFSFFTGEQYNLAEFGSQIIPFGLAMKMYSLAVTGFNAEAVTASATAGSALVELAKTLPETGGLFEFFTGEKDLAGFAQDLIPFGLAMKMYSLVVAGLDASSIQASATGAAALIEVMNSLKDSNGVFQFFTGEKDLAGFAQDLIPFGLALKMYSVSVMGIDVVSVSNSVYAANRLVELVNSTDGIKTGGVKSFVEAINTLGTANVDAFVSAFSGASEKMEGIGSDLVGYVISGLNSGIEKLSAAAMSLASNAVSAFSAVIAAAQPMSMASGNALVNNFVSGINAGRESAKTAASGVANDAVNSFKVSVVVASISATAAGISLATNLASGIKSAVGSINSSITELVSSAIETAKNKGNAFVSCGETLMKNFSSGISESTNVIKSAINSAVSSAAATIRGYYGSFYNAGYYVSIGFANGIASGSFMATIRARAMANAAAAAARSALNEHSPSKVLYEIGAYAGEGFTNALNDYAPISAKAGENMANSATDGISKSISSISDALNTDLDVNPTIRPVLDLSDVRSGADSINGMFDSLVPMDVLSRVNSISRSMDSRIQNGSFNDVVGAIDKLRTNLSELGGTIYNVDGVTYDDGTNVANAVNDLTRAIRLVRRV